jgi:hypothetical protein
MSGILDVAREQVLERGEGLSEAQVLEVLRLPDERVDEALALAHEVRMRWCGPEVEIEGIVSIKTGGCPEDCHFCSQSGRFETSVRAVRIDIPSLVEAARQTAATGATEFCIVAAVRGPDERLMAQVREAIAAIRAAVDVNIACSLGILTPEQADELQRMGVHRYNHNLEAARSHFPQVVTTHTWEERHATLELVRERGMEVCCGGIIGMGESLEQRAELAAQLAEVDPHEVLPRRAARDAVRGPLRGRGRRRAADDRGVPARAAADDPALRRRARADARRPRLTARRARGNQRPDRRQLPDDARPRPARGPRSARRAVDAGQGALEDAVSGPDLYCDGCGALAAAGDHARCRARAGTDPPRWCSACGRKLAVQVLPVGWTARCLACDPARR